MSIVAIGGIALAMVLLAGTARVGAAAVLRARADNAADAAALAAADALALGHGDRAARTAAIETAARNGARLVSCDCSGHAAAVVVAIAASAALHIHGPVLGRARAEIDPSSVVAPP